MIRYVKGDLLQSSAQALVNTVNTVGVMGKGIALQFKNAYPDNYKVYHKVCAEGKLTVGQMLVTEVKDIFGHNKYIINFPTKTTWRKPSEYIYIQQGLVALRHEIISRSITSIAIPPLGSKNGGLDWERVRPMIESALADLSCDIIIYEPTDQILDRLNAEKVKLTPARAMLLDVLCDMVSYGEFASEFASEKIVYFFQRFGASDIFNLSFHRAFYGPYSGKVRYVLHYLNGSYIMGMVDLQKKPFDEFWILPETPDAVSKYLSSPENAIYQSLSQQVKEFLRGFYSNYSLELLATVDYILNTDASLGDWRNMDQQLVLDKVIADISEWSARKEKMFSKPEYIKIMLNHLKDVYAESRYQSN